MLTMDLQLMAAGFIGARELTEELLEQVTEFLSRLSGVEEPDLEKVRKQLEASIGISMVTGEGLNDGEQAPWVEEVKASVDWHYWDSYVKQLKATGFGAQVVRALDEDTDNILTECGNPSIKAAWRIQGLVMGDVQSGKTASYCGLISKAADAGYKIIVLLTGMIEALRSQSQERLDEGFVGRDSRNLILGVGDNLRIGAGRFRQKTPNVLTSVDSDFLTANHRALGGIPLQNVQEPVLLVMKKNTSALNNLLGFLKSQGKGSGQLALPLLLVDDEADNASVNAKKDDDPATINRLIRELLDRFQQASYVAYTATPFANVFINPDGNDLFPRNFVYSLNAPSSYVGAASIFSESGEYSYQLQDITDAEQFFPDKHKKDHPVESLPESLEGAIATFLLSCAIRDLRAEPLKHRSMLVNVTRFTDVQRQLAEVLKAHLYTIVEEVKQYLADEDLWARQPRLRDLHDRFVEHYENCGFTWDEVRTQLYDSVASVKVLTINQKSDQSERLNYKDYRNSEKGRRAIVVGGLTLSRGLTLEGLCISYFYRNSKAYDTLLQMGRWFGYRPGYGDLCRLWMDPDVQDWFGHIADVVGELRADIRRMHANRQPPSQFGMRVRAHPGALIVTATNKMRNAAEVELKLSFSGYAAETPFLPKNPDRNRHNVERAAAFLQRLGPAKVEGSRYLWSGVSPREVADFLREMDVSPMNMAFVPNMEGGELPLITFIRENKVDALQQWDICLAQGEGIPTETFKVSTAEGSACPVKPRMRQFENTTSRSADYLKVNKQRVGEIADEKVGLSKDQIREVEELWRESPGNERKVVPGNKYREKRSRPLLTLHPVQPSNPKDMTKKSAIRIMGADQIRSDLLIALGLAFPRFGDSETTAVPYRLNRVSLMRLGLIDEETDDDDED